MRISFKLMRLPIYLLHNTYFTHIYKYYCLNLFKYYVNLSAEQQTLL